VRPVGVAAGRRVEEHWAHLTDPKQIEALCHALQRLLAALEDHRD
jgi:hypothetical protein